MEDDAKAQNQSWEWEEELLDAGDLEESVGIVRRRLEAADRGEGGVPAEEVLAEMWKAIGI